MASIDFELKDLLGWAGGAAVVVSGWVLKQLRSKASRSDVKASIERIEAALEKTEERAAKHRSEIYNAIRAAVERQADTNVEMSATLGKLEGAISQMTRR